MFILLLYILNLLLLLSSILGIYLDSGERRFSLALVQALLCLPLLAGEYLYFTYHQEVEVVQLVLFSEIVFALIWLAMARRLRSAMAATVQDTPVIYWIEFSAGALVTGMAGYFLVYRSMTEISPVLPAFNAYSPVYFSTVFILITVFYTAWRLEQFWRALNVARRWGYKFLVVGIYLVCGALAWAASYRLTFLAIFPNHVLLLSTLLLAGWALMSYAVVHHRLLNRKIFVSRKIVYSVVVPSIFATYLLGFGIVSLIMNAFGLQLSFVLRWLALILGLVVIGLFALSGKLRRRIHFFISTHFYINKYEYRDEWLDLSQQLQGVTTETDVFTALRRVLSESLYTTEIFIWSGAPHQGYVLIYSPDNLEVRSNERDISSNDPLVQFFNTHSYFHVKEQEPDAAWQIVMKNKARLLHSLHLTLISPISVGKQLYGLIGLGPEFTGGQYGHDDFDLLSALGSQTASTLLAVRMAEELARSREQRAWNRLSAFVLHDIKNAATMLSLLQENAPDHIHEPEFQQDILELVDDALQRMDRVEQRLLVLKDEIKPNLQNLTLDLFMQDCCRRMEKKIPLLKIDIACTDTIQVRSDPEILLSILENLFLNAFEAQGEGTIVEIKASTEDNRTAVIEIGDNGPGIAEELLPDSLFEPFKTSKSGGSGIGLWQARRGIASLGGSVSAENTPKGGALFVIMLPLVASTA